MSFLSSMFSANTSGPNTRGPKMQTISAASAVRFHGDPDSVFVDVRGPGEISMSGTVAGALVAPLPEFARHARPDGSGTLPAASSGKRIILVCASGARSGVAAQRLVGLGYTDVANLCGGIIAWKQAGGPLGR